MVERETEDVYVYDDLEQLRLVVAEFWDILDQDFAFFTASGNHVRFDMRFLRGQKGLTIEAEQDQEFLRRVLSKYAADHGIAWTPAEPIELFASRYAE